MTNRTNTHYLQHLALLACVSHSIGSKGGTDRPSVKRHRSKLFKQNRILTFQG